MSKDPTKVAGVTLNKASTAITVGGTEQLFPAVSPVTATNQNLTWSVTSGAAYVSVAADGTVTANAAGTAVVTVTTVDGGFTDSCTVTVNPLIIPATGVTVKASTSIVVGGIEQLLPTVLPVTATNQNVTWAVTSGSAYAAVSAGGVITGLATGTAVVTVTTDDGGFIADCTVTVSASSVAVTGVMLKSDTTIIVGGAEQLLPTILPVTATNQNVTWTVTSGSAYAAVSPGGTITGLAEGTAVVTVTTTDGGFTANCTVTVSSASVAVSNVYLQDSLDLYPLDIFMLSITFDPSNATNQNVTWSVDDNSVAEVSAGGVIIAKVPGHAVVKVTTADGGKTAVCNINVVTSVAGNTETPAIGGVSFEMVLVPGGMIFPSGTSDTFTAPVVSPFRIGKTEISYDLWYQVCEWAKGTPGYTCFNTYKQGREGSSGVNYISTPPANVPANSQPVTSVSWRAAMVWCNALTEYYNSLYDPDLKCVYYTDSALSTPIKSYDISAVVTTQGTQDNPYVDYDADGFRLPTDSEWECAARFRGHHQTGSVLSTPQAPGYYWNPFNYASGAPNATNDDDIMPYAWYTMNSSGITKDVGTTGDNTQYLGLYDMSGNVAEFCWSDAALKKARGGMYYSIRSAISVTSELSISPDVSSNNAVGFRVARTSAVTGDSVTLSGSGIQFGMTYVGGGYTFPTGTGDSGSETVAKPFWIGQTEVTYGVWEKVRIWAIDIARGASQYTFANSGACGGGAGVHSNNDPVTTMSWRDAMVWSNAATEWFNNLNGTSLTCVYLNGGTPFRDATMTLCDSVVPDSAATGFRLLSHNEWELAARYRGSDSINSVSGFSNPYFTKGNSASGARNACTVAIETDPVSWYDMTSGGGTHAVKGKNPNTLWLFDMSGNVREWCFDIAYSSYRGYLGGSWYNDNSLLQIGDFSQGNGASSYATGICGFRIGRN